MSIPSAFSYHFYPVGQGLFATGSICRPGEEKPHFLWVYDCGTSSQKELVQRGIEQLGKSWGGRIDLLTLSHFDHDHISGVCDLLKKFKVGTLLLPYMPLAQRLVHLFKEGRGDDAGFYLNPVAFLLERAKREVKLVLFVPPSGSEGPPYSEEVGEHRGEISYYSKDPEDSGEVELLRSDVPLKKGTSVEFLRPGSRITMADYLWEFIPYNDDRNEAIPDEFVRKVEEERNNLLSDATDTDRRASLDRLKKVYDDHFGTSDTKRNVISLFLYSGPIYASGKVGRLLPLATAEKWHRCPPPCKCAWKCCEPDAPTSDSRCSILYTGDGYLNTPDRLEKLKKYLDQRRVDRIGVFQVMHHGAEKNWHEGVATSIKPRFSVFSSDPKRKNKHPHALVLRDFREYGVVQVDKTSDFTVCGCIK